MLNHTAPTPPTDTPTIGIRVFGSFDAQHGGTPLAVVNRQPSLHMVLVWLICHPDQPLSRAHTAFTLWPDTSERQARANLRQSLYMLRASLGPDAPLHIDTHTIALCHTPSLWVDLWAFWDGLAHADDPASLESLADLYRGDLLAGCYAEWLLPLRDQCRQQYQRLLERLIEHYERQHAVVEAIATTRRLLASDPFQERHVQGLMLRLARAGDRAAALACYEDLVALLDAELGTAPLPETAAVAAQLRAAPSSAPQRRLPAYLTSFVGRDQDHAALVSLLCAVDTRLITLLGPGGIGKTRLAVACVRTAATAFADGAWWVPLESTTDASGMIAALAHALGVVLPERADPFDHLIATLDGQQLLLLLDNIEQLVGVAGTIESILQAVSGLTILATSRTRLHLPGEQVYELAGLSVDGADAPAIQLLTQRGRAAYPAFAASPGDQALIGRICRLLEGVPLALELVASWARMLSCADMVAMIEQGTGLAAAAGDTGRPLRHQSMQVVFDATWRLLDFDDQRLLCQLAVFRGGWDRAAAAAIGTTSPGRLAMLTAQSLIRWDGVERYAMHGAVRHFALERLAAQPDSATAFTRHRAYFLARAEDAEAASRGGQREAMATALDRDHENMRAALESSLADGDDETALRLSAALWWFWEARGHLHEGRRWLQAVLDASSTDAPLQQSPAWQSARARALSSAGSLAWGQGDYAEADALFRASLELRRALEDDLGIATILNNLGAVAYDRGRVDQAIAYHEECLAIFREAGDQYRAAVSLNNLGVALLGADQPDRARTVFQESLDLRRRLGDRQGSAISLDNLSRVALYQGDTDQALAYAEESLAIMRTLNDPWSLAYSLTSLAMAHVRRHDAAAADLAVRESLPILVELGDRPGIAQALDALAGVYALRGQWTDVARLRGATDGLREQLGASLAGAERAFVDAVIALARPGVADADWNAAWNDGYVRGWDHVIASATPE